MKKFLLVVLVGMVLVMDVCGIVKQYIDSIPGEETIDKSVTIVYVE